MVSRLQRTGTGSGIALGAGVAGTAALLSGVTDEFAVVAGFGVLAGIVVGNVAGRYAERRTDRDGTTGQVVAYTVALGLVAGAFIGIVTAWMVTGSIAWGLVVGSASGVVFGLLLSWVLVASAGRRRVKDATVGLE